MVPMVSRRERLAASAECERYGAQVDGIVADLLDPARVALEGLGDALDHDSEEEDGAN